MADRYSDVAESLKPAIPLSLVLMGYCGYKWLQATHALKKLEHGESNSK